MRAPTKHLNKSTRCKNQAEKAASVNSAQNNAGRHAGKGSSFYCYSWFKEGRVNVPKVASVYHNKQRYDYISYLFVPLSLIIIIITIISDSYYCLCVSSLFYMFSWMGYFWGLLEMDMIFVNFLFLSQHNQSFLLLFMYLMYINIYFNNYFNHIWLFFCHANTGSWTHTCS